MKNTLKLLQTKGQEKKLHFCNHYF